MNRKIKHVNSPSKGRLTFSEMLDDIRDYMLADKKRTYTIVVGTDSQQNYKTDFVTAFVIHRVGAGGRYFWVREKQENLKSLRQRIYLEALMSLEAVQQLTGSLYKVVKEEDGHNFNIEVHVDVGENGPTKEMIKEVVGMIRGSGYEVKTKPLGYGAFVVADRHT